MDGNPLTCEVLAMLEQDIVRELEQRGWTEKNIGGPIHTSIERVHSDGAVEVKLDAQCESIEAVAYTITQKET